MMAAICSASCRTAGARSSIAAMAVPTKIENTTICRISLLAMASTIERGKTWVMKSFRVKAVAVTPLGGSVAATMCMPRPGWIRLTSSAPRISETTEAIRNQPMVLTPTRPMAAESSMWAMPTTRVENTSGAMIIRISRRKMSVIRAK